MSPAPKSKSKDKSTPRGAGKEQSKVVSSIKTSPLHANIENGSSVTTAYNPVLGTFHALDMPSSSSAPPHINDPEDHSGNSAGTTAEYDSLSNNGSCSGESEDQKEKPTSTSTSTAPRIEAIPGCDSDKREKIRQKNERKHQRQRERRAQDLHERCNAFLTSRKLEALSHQLVAMGFPIDRATMAIIINEGRMEESVAWLLHDGEDDDNKQHASLNFEDKSHIKVEISDELARLAEMEVKYKCTKQDVERAVVACEGDLFKAEDSLRSQKQAPSLKTDESVDSTGGGLNDKISTPKNHIKGATTSIQHQQRKDERFSKTLIPETLPQESTTNRNLQQAFKKMQQTTTKPADKRWLTMSSAPSASRSYTPVQVSGHTLKSEPPQFAATMGFPAGAPLKEPPFIVMRRPKQNMSPSSSSIDMCVSPPASIGWYPNGAPGMEILSVAAAAAANGGLGQNLAGMSTSSRQYYPQNNLRAMPSGSPELSGWSGHSWNNASGATSSSLAIPSSLGLFTGWGLTGSSGSSSQNDWNTSGSTPHRDYTSIDWSLDLTPLRPSLKTDMVSETWPTMFMGGNAARPLVNVGGGGVYLPGLQEGSSGGLLNDPSVVQGSSSHEWTNPFEGRDLFRVPRQYVTSPSL